MNRSKRSVIAPMLQVTLALSLAACGARVDVGSAAGGGNTGGSGGSTSTQGGGGASACDLPIGTPCDCDTFPKCAEETVQGMPCCSIRRMCGATGECVVGWSGAICTDSCDIQCENATNLDQCAAIGCLVQGNKCVTPPQP
ncbi:MAG: hypothetical protein U0441_21160 [Polyangiaceae bacterium]